MRRYLVQLTRHPLDPERRETLAAAGMLRADWRTRSVVATDYVYADADTEEEAVAIAMANAHIPLDCGEIITAAECLPDGKTRPRVCCMNR